MKKIIICFLIVFTSSMTILSQSKKIDKLKINYIESSQLKVDNRKLPIVKWENKDTLKYSVNGKLKFMSKKNWGKFINEIENLININIIETNNIQDSDIKIYFGELNDYFKIHRIKVPINLISSNFDNWSNRNYNKNKQLTSASYCIVTSKTKNSKRGVYNLKKQFLKSLGLLGNLDNEYSIFYKSQTEGNSQLKRNDKRLIKIHYNDSIKAGMNSNEIKEVLNSIDLATIIKEKY